MKNLKGSLILAVLWAILSASFAIAQGSGGTPLPPCCEPNGGGAPAMLTDRDAKPAQNDQHRITISDSIVRLMGISRTEFIDRLSASLFPGRRIELVLSSTSLVDPGALLIRKGRGGFEPMDSDRSVVAVQLKRFYQVPRSLARSEEIDAQDQIFITDGESYIEVRFQGSESSAQVR